MATRSKIPQSGEAVAAFLSAMIGLFVMGLVNLGTEASSSFQAFVLSVGKAWIPYAQGIGPYSGKETFFLISWLGSWFILYYALKNRDMKITLPAIIFVIGIGLSTLLFYTPFIDFILGK